MDFKINGFKVLFKTRPQQAAQLIAGGGGNLIAGGGGNLIAGGGGNVVSNNGGNRQVIPQDQWIRTR